MGLGSAATFSLEDVKIIEQCIRLLGRLGRLNSKMPIVELPFNAVILPPIAMRLILSIN